MNQNVFHALQNPVFKLQKQNYILDGSTSGSEFVKKSLVQWSSFHLSNGFSGTPLTLEKTSKNRGAHGHRNRVREMAVAGGFAAGGVPTRVVFGNGFRLQLPVPVSRKPVSFQRCHTKDRKCFRRTVFLLSF